MTEEIGQNIETIGIENFYKEKIVNQKTSSTKIATYFLKNLCEGKNLFDGIQQITREKSYKTSSHKEVDEETEETYRKEEWQAKKMYGKTYDFIGELIDYQTPLKNKRNDKIRKVGKIDMLGYNQREQKLFLIELKAKNSKETLLRCLLEIYTYYKTINQDKLLSDFGLEHSTKVIPSILVFKRGKQHEQIMNEQAVMALANKLKIEIFIYETLDTTKYLIEKV